MWDMFKNAKAFNQNISNWDVSSVTDMLQMFNGASAFSQDLSGWCMSNLSRPPTDFSTNSGLNSNQLPKWGTCPSSATLALSTNDPDNLITTGLVTITASFSENMETAPLVSISGIVTNSTMS